MKFDKEVEKHREFQRQSKLRINKLIAQRDPLYSNRYHEKRNLLLVKLQTVGYEMDCLQEKIGRKEYVKTILVSDLKKLDEAFKNYEPM